eukprot:403374657
MNISTKQNNQIETVASGLLLNKYQTDNLSKHQKDILDAIQRKDKEQFIQLGGATNADLNFNVSQDRVFPLLIACANGEQDIVQNFFIYDFSLDFVNLILNNKFLEINKQDSFGVNAFWISAFYGHFAIMKRLLEKGVDIYARNHNGSNVLHISVKKNNVAIVEELIKMKYPLDYAKNNGITAVGIAAYKGYIKILEILTLAGADIQITSKNGISPLYLAIKANQVQCAQYLIEKKVQLYYNDPVKSDSSPIFFAIKCGNLKMVELICDSGIDLTMCQSSMGYSPITYASSLNQHEILNHLTLRGHDANQEDPQNFSPFARYVLFNNFDNAKKLLQRGANIDYTNREGKTAVIMAIEQLRLESIKFLLQNGANPHVEDFTGKDACDYARLGNIKAFSELLQCNNQANRKKPVLNSRMKGQTAINQAYHNINQKVNNVAQSRGKLQQQDIDNDINRVEYPINIGSPQSNKPKSVYTDNSVTQILHSVSPVQSLNLKKQIIQQQNQNVQQQRQLPLFLREDYVYGVDNQPPPDPKFINPLQYVYDRSNINKQELKNLDEQIQKMDFETQVMTQMNSNIIDNVNSDISRKSLNNTELRRRRERERVQLEVKKKQMKEDLIQQITRSEFKQLEEGEPYEKDKFEADTDYKKKLVEQESKIRSIHEESDQMKNRLRESYYNLNTKLDKINRSRGDLNSQLAKSRTTINPNAMNDFTNNMTSLFDKSTSQYGIQSVPFNNYQTLKESIDHQHRQKMNKEDFESVYRMKKQQEQMMLELEHKKRERERKLQVQEFESVTNKAGMRLEELRRNISSELKRTNSKNLISRGDDKILMYKSEIARELRDGDIQTLRSRMVQSRKHIYKNEDFHPGLTNNTDKFSSFERATIQTIKTDYNPYQTDVLNRLYNLSHQTGRNKNNQSQFSNYATAEPLKLPKVNFVDSRPQNTYSGYQGNPSYKFNVRSASVAQGSYESPKPQLVKHELNSGSQKSITYDPYTAYKMSRLIDRLNVSSLREDEIDHNNSTNNNSKKLIKDESTQYLDPPEPKIIKPQIDEDANRKYLDMQKGLLDYQMYLNQQETNKLVFQIKDKLDRIDHIGAKRSISQPKYNYSSMLKAVGNHTAQQNRSPIQAQDRFMAIVKPIVGANPGSGLRLASDIRARDKLIEAQSKNLSRNLSQNSLNQRSGRSNYQSPSSKMNLLMPMQEIQMQGIRNRN